MKKGPKLSINRISLSTKERTPASLCPKTFLCPCGERPKTYKNLVV
jgi:hypothetical protein